MKAAEEQRNSAVPSERLAYAATSVTVAVSHYHVTIVGIQ
jgi:hypothetical protein